MCDPKLYEQAGAGPAADPRARQVAQLDGASQAAALPPSAPLGAALPRVVITPAMAARMNPPPVSGDPMTMNPDNERIERLQGIRRAMDAGQL